MGASAPLKQDYVVLARKYRSQTFGELIGQDALVRTLTNAIKAEKLHHAYVLTGIRGVGKTSTARLLAMALNCQGGPSVTWADNDPDVAAIRTGTHVDVLEYDAASNRSVEDVSQLFEGVAYAPVQGRYKVYIIDEVHMLSNHAFNALLKTLEEPPPRVKFIFATTEVNKIPVTVLSRCQRFDLKRVPSEVLLAHFTEILGKEGVEAEPSAVALVAKAADGSVRDGLSLLDQAIALSDGKILEATVQDMLGLADRGRIYTLIEALLTGDTAAAMSVLDELFALGVDEGLVVEGMLEAVHLATRIKIVPGLKDSISLTEVERDHAVPLADAVGMPNLARLYQMALQAADEVKRAARPYEALQMALVRMAYLAPLPPVSVLMEQAQGALGKSAGAMHVAPAPVVQPVVAAVRPPWDVPAEEIHAADEQPAAEAVMPAAIKPATWADIVKLVEGKKGGLAAALKSQVRCEHVENTTLRLEITGGLYDKADILRDLRSILLDVTGETFDIQMVSGSAAATLHEEGIAAGVKRKQDAARDPMVAAALEIFPGAELVAVEAFDDISI